MATDAGVPGRVRGMRDLLPDDMDRVRLIEATFASTCRAWGYREVRTPVIEPLYLFTAAGTLSPKTLDRVYSFLDWDGWSGERVVLRPDSTIPAARLYTEHFGSDAVAKLFYRQNIFRFTDDGSSREEWQCGVELIGDTGLAGDVELALLATETVRALGLPDVALHVSHAGIVRAVLAAAAYSSDEQVQAYDRLLDGDLSVVDEVEARMPGLNAPLRLLFDVEGAGSAYLANVRASLARAVPALVRPIDELSFVVAALEALGIQPVIQAVLARSFEYYSGPLFKMYAGGTRVASGGRYDGLLALVGDRSVPASGFALYVTPAIEAMPQAAPSSDTIVVLVQPAADSNTLVARVQEAAARLRAAGMTALAIAPEGLEPTHRLRCRADGFELSGAGDSATLTGIDDVVAALRAAS